MRFPSRALLRFIPQNDVRINHSISIGELGKKYKIAKKLGVAQEEIRHETDLFFRLMEQMVEVRHQHKMIRIGHTIHSCPIGDCSIEHFPFVQLADVTGQTVFIGSEQQTPAIESGIHMGCRFHKTG